ncbi:MAG: CvpA family protein [Tannerella sp.]|jgi:membrane protein required for colicin V production|nr:CvpA family protein [Tannerella sp.]
MNWLDIVILILLGVGLLKGLYDGMIKQIVSLAALVIGFYLCAGVAEWLRGYLVQFEWFPQKAAFITSYFIGFVIIAGVVLLAGNIVHRLISATPLSVFNHIIGGLVGLIIMILAVSFILNILEMFDRYFSILPQEIKVESRFYYIIKNIIPAILPGKMFGLIN